MGTTYNTPQFPHVKECRRARQGYTHCGTLQAVCNKYLIKHSYVDVQICPQQNNPHEGLTQSLFVFTQALKRARPRALPGVVTAARSSLPHVQCNGEQEQTEEKQRKEGGVTTNTIQPRSLTVLSLHYLPYIIVISRKYCQPFFNVCYPT